PVNVVLIQNHGYASIGGLSESVGGERYGTAYRHRAADGTFTGPPLPVDLAANAASLGMEVLRAKTVGELRAALTEARASDRPTCVYVETDPSPTAPPAEAWWDVPVAEVAGREAARSEEHTLNSSHVKISYAVFCLKKKTKMKDRLQLVH